MVAATADSGLSRPESDGWARYTCGRNAKSSVYPRDRFKHRKPKLSPRSELLPSRQLHRSLVFPSRLPMKRSRTTSWGHHWLSSSSRICDSSPFVLLNTVVAKKHPAKSLLRPLAFSLRVAPMLRVSFAIEYTHHCPSSLAGRLRAVLYRVARPQIAYRRTRQVQKHLPSILSDHTRHTDKRTPC
jgi:hypothetical protein